MIKIGASVELQIGNYEKIKNDLAKVIENGDALFLEKILFKFGKKINDSYLLFLNENAGEYNSYYNVSGFIDRYYGIEDSHDVFFEHMESLQMNHSIVDVEEEFDIELPVNED
jgi:hypothetical protein